MDEPRFCTETRLFSLQTNKQLHTCGCTCARTASVIESMDPEWEHLLLTDCCVTQGAVQGGGA